MKRVIYGSRRLQKRNGLQSSDIEAFTAAEVLAGGHIVLANHVGLRFGETGAVTLIRIAGQGTFLTPHQPGELIFIRLAAVWTS